MFFVSEIEAVSMAGVFQRCGAIDEEDGVIDIMFLAEFGEGCVGENVCSGWFKLCMKQFVCIRIDSGVQPVAFVIELNHGLVNCDVIRMPTRFGL